jgi:hypothetical protein
MAAVQDADLANPQLRAVMSHLLEARAQTHVSHILAKLGARSRAEIASHALPA